MFDEPARDAGEHGVELEHARHLESDAVEREGGVVEMADDETEVRPNCDCRNDRTCPEATPATLGALYAIWAEPPSPSA